MALTWQGKTPRESVLDSVETHLETPTPAIRYQVNRQPELTFSVALPDQKEQRFPVEVTMGGARHGLSLLARVAQLDKTALSRAPLVETRYLQYAPDHRLKLSPGFPKEKPANYETAIGRVLTPKFEEKCLSCHGAPAAHREAGVTCESCHGAGGEHPAAVAKKSADKAILNPAKLPVAEQMKPCAQCHAGFSKVVDPMPDDLLISDQVTALSNSECWRQSGGRITCTNCHNPHQDAPRAELVARSERTCLGCHAATVAARAALCPVNRKNGCVGCHMPESDASKPFVISDHWIRVHPEQSVQVTQRSAAWRSKVTPEHLFVRLMVLDNAAKANAVYQQLAQGAAFFDLARANSLDAASARNGGYLGDLTRKELDPAWAAVAVALQPGEVSAVVASGGKYYIVGRMPRNFREDAEARFNQAMEVRKAGNRQGAANGFLEALKIDPYLLRALTYLGVTYAEAGNPQVGSGILNVALRYYPQDPGAHFNLGIAEGAMGNAEETEEYRKTLELDPDYVPAYLNWGSALFAKGQVDTAIAMYRRGIEVNPLQASLHYNLSLALEKANQNSAAAEEKALALKIDPAMAARQ
jgi:predicted CXXCH cytochrome family protein